MTININGEQVPGVFMEQAEGEDLSRVEPGSKLEKFYQYYKNNMINGNFKGPSMQAQKDLFSLQVLDYICNNIDRHRGNLMYKIENNQLVGLQGIDNDRSFGIDVYKKDENLGRLKYALNIDDLKYVPRQMAQAIKQLNPKVLDLVLKGYQLSEEERQAVIARVDQVKKALAERDLDEVTDEQLQDSEFVYNYHVKVNGFTLGNVVSGLQFAVKQELNSYEENKNPNKPINYTRAGYSKPAAIPSKNMEVVSGRAAEILKTKTNKANTYRSEMSNLKNWLHEMQVTDSQVKLGSKRFQKLEEAVQTLENVYAKMEKTIRENHFRRKLPETLESELMTALYQLQTKAQVYLSGKDPLKEKKPAEQVRYDSAVKLKQFAESGIKRQKTFSMLEKDPSDSERIVTFEQLKDYLGDQKETYCKNGRQFMHRKISEELAQVDPKQFNDDKFTRTELRAVYMDLAGSAGAAFEELFNHILPGYDGTTFEEAGRVYQFLKQHKAEEDLLKKYADDGNASPQQYQAIYDHLRKDYDPSEMYSVHKNFESAAKGWFAIQILKELGEASGKQIEEFEASYKQRHSEKQGIAIH